MDYIRPFGLEKLLTYYQALTCLIESLKLQVEAMYDEDEEDIIRGMALKRNLDGLPRGKGIVSDRTASITLNTHSNIRDEVKEVCQELLLVELNLS